VVDYWRLAVDLGLELRCLSSPFSIWHLSLKINKDVHGMDALLYQGER